MSGYPVVYINDWCGDHKLDEDEAVMTPEKEKIKQDKEKCYDSRFSTIIGDGEENAT
jgi:hypothetical protein